jgi:hypothetical protein
MKKYVIGLETVIDAKDKKDAYNKLHKMMERDTYAVILHSIREWNEVLRNEHGKH